MDKNVSITNVVSSADLTDKEGFVVDFAGALITDKGTGCYGVIYGGQKAGIANEIVYAGETEAYVEGVVAVNDPLTAGGGTVTDTDGDTYTGTFTKATYGDTSSDTYYPVRAYAMEAISTTTVSKIKVFLV